MPNRAKYKRPKAVRVKRSPMARSVDRHVLYQEAVQCVEAEIDFVDETFTAIRKRKAARLREDFCGTAQTSCEWVKRRPSNVAVGVDLDPATLAWGIEHNVSALKPRQRERLSLVRGNVLTSPREQPNGLFDVVLAMNFSYWCLKQRATMLHYFRNVRESLRDDGVFFLDHYGGPDAIRSLKEPRPCGRKGSSKAFTYIWDQAEVNPITGDTTCHIHFKLSDGSRLNRAFTYHWRIWSIPELRDILHEAGFVKTTVYWEGDDSKGGGNGVFTATEKGEDCLSYICYISAEK
jgi:SAM-dependent methyltransferase